MMDENMKNILHSCPKWIYSGDQTVWDKGLHVPLYSGVQVIFRSENLYFPRDGIGIGDSFRSILPDYNKGNPIIADYYHDGKKTTINLSKKYGHIHVDSKAGIIKYGGAGTGC